MNLVRNTGNGLGNVKDSVDWEDPVWENVHDSFRGPFGRSYAN